MLLIRLALPMLVVAAAVVAVADAWWLSGPAILVLVAMTVAAAVLLLHYTGTSGSLGPRHETQLQNAALVEPETDLPKRRGWQERRRPQSTPTDDAILTTAARSPGVNAVVSLAEAREGYQAFDKGATRKYVLDPHGNARRQAPQLRIP